MLKIDSVPADIYVGTIVIFGSVRSSRKYCAGQRFLLFLILATVFFIIINIIESLNIMCLRYNNILYDI